MLLPDTAALLLLLTFDSQHIVQQHRIEVTILEAICTRQCV